MGQSLRHAGVGDEGVREPALAGGRQGLGNPLQPNERCIRIRGQRESRRHDREHVGQDLSQPCGGIHQPVEHGVGGARLAESQPRQQLLGGRTIDAGPGDRRPGEGLEQGPVEQSLVQPPDERGLPTVLGLQLVGSIQVERASQPGQRRPVPGELVGLEVTDHLEAVLHPSKESIRAGQGLRVVLGDVAFGRQDGEGAERVRLAQSRIAAAVHDLEELHRELDVADPAPPPLDLDPGLAPGSHVLLQADLHPAHLLDGMRGELLAVHEGGDQVHEGPPHAEIARNGPGLDQRLPFPCQRLRRVVLAHRGEGASQRAASATRPERGIDAERDALGRRRGQEADDLGGRSLCPAVSLGSATFGHEQHVDVGGVVQLGPSELAQPDDGESPCAHAPARVRETSVGDGGDLLDDLLHRGAGEVARGDAHHGPAPEHAQAVGEPQPSDVGGKLGVELVGASHPDVLEQRGLLGMRDQEVRGGDGEPHQAGGDGQHVLPCQHMAGPWVLPHPRDGQPCELGIGGFGQRSAHDLRGQHGCPSLIGARTATGTAGRPASPPRRRGIRLRQRRSPTHPAARRSGRGTPAR